MSYKKTTQAARVRPAILQWRMSNMSSSTAPDSRRKEKSFTRLANGLLEPETIVGFMLENERNWEATSSFASK
ncbi:unnamed protein product, partial [Trichogramma brassicae]